jgi:hypothetical protein
MKSLTFLLPASLFLVLTGVGINYQTTAVTSPGPCTEASFSSPKNFILGVTPQSIAVGDFNEDGDTDLAVADQGDNSTTNKAFVLLGDGMGGFGDPISLTVGSGSFSVTTADFNKDNNLDLAVANSGSNDVSILLGDGAGGFGAAMNFPVPSTPRSVTAADLNGDGNLDLVTANSETVLSNNVSILPGNGMGSFGVADNFSAGFSPVFVAVEDYNEDGKLDLAVANFGSNDVSILLGDGTGKFDFLTDLPVGSNPASIAVGDYNEDGKTDLAVSNQSTNNVSILLGKGLGGFSAAINFMVGTTPRSVAAADYDGDGHLDLAVPNQTSRDVSILLGNGMGGFSAAKSFQVSLGAEFVAPGDFNKDGKTDLAVAGGPLSSNVAILLNDCTPAVKEVTIDIKPGSFPNSINPENKGVTPVAILTTGGFDAANVDPTTVRFGANGTEAAPAHSALEDVDNDGDLDLILQFSTQSTGILCGATSASLTGTTLSGQQIKGTDSVNTVGCK